MRWFEQHRMEWIAEALRVFGFINREHLERKFGISTPQASADLNMFMTLNPDAMSYDKSAKRYISTAAIDAPPAAHRYDKASRTLIPSHSGYYWAKWRIAADGTHEGEEQTPSDTWEIVQVNENNVDDPDDDEYLSVSVPGVQQTQWRDCFVWGLFVAPLWEDGSTPPRARAAREAAA